MKTLRTKLLRKLFFRSMFSNLFLVGFANFVSGIIILRMDYFQIALGLLTSSTIIFCYSFLSLIQSYKGGSDK